MNRIILDQLRRRWWIWALFGLLSMTAGLIVGIERDIRISVICYVSISVVFMDWGFGGPRVLLSLPFTARQIGRAYWWIAVGVSTLIFALFSGLGILILGLVGALGKYIGPRFEMFVTPGPNDKFVGIWLWMVLAGGLICGSFFWLMSGAIWAAAVSRTGEPWRKRLQRQLYACAIVVASIAAIYFICKSTLSITEKVAIAYFFGFVFSVLGWFRAEKLFIDGNFRPDVARAGVTRGKFEPQPGYGGVPYLVIRVCLFYLAVVAFMIATVIGLGSIGAWMHWSKWSEVVSPALLEFQFYLFFFFFIQTMIIGTHLKYLRSLPLTSKQLAATILCLAIVPVLIIGGPWILFVLIAPGILPALSILKFILLNFAPACVLTTGVIWYSERFRRIVAVVLAWIVSVVPIIYQLATESSGGLPVWFIAAVPVVSCLITLIIVRRLLERNEMSYRIKWEMLGYRS